jgi:hypothetical protein
MTFAARTLNAAAAGGSTTRYTGTITQGFASDGSFIVWYGFDDVGNSGYTFGSSSPTTVSTYTFASFYDIYYGASPIIGYLSISGFAADPGIDFITSATIGTFTQYPSYYTYSAGQATWGFPTVFNFGASGTIACVLTGV